MTSSTFRLSVFVTGLYSDLPDKNDPRLYEEMRPFVGAIRGGFEKFEALAEATHFATITPAELDSVGADLGTLLEQQAGWWPLLRDTVQRLDRGTAQDAWNQEVEARAFAQVQQTIRCFGAWCRELLGTAGTMSGNHDAHIASLKPREPRNSESNNNGFDANGIRDVAS